MTGGTGFIGKWVVPLLVRRGAAVAVLTRQSAESPVFRTEGVSHLPGDLASIATVSQAVQAFRPEALVHLAWSGLPDYSSGTSLHNLELGLAVYLAALNGGVRTIITAGSCWEYNLRRGRLREDDPSGSNSAFSSVKTALRLVGQCLAAEQAARFYWLRFFFVYGPGQRSIALVPSILDAAQHGRPPQIKTPENRHDFIYVADAARAVAGVLEKRPAESLFNVGCGLSTPVADVVRMAYRSLNLVPPLLGLTGTHGGEIQDYWADTDRIQESVGWSPHVDLKSGVQAVSESRITEAV
ncbi:MAG: NAD-dependent epimerase/dehydratase family protein [Pirellulaceae bacterium]